MFTLKYLTIQDIKNTAIYTVNATVNIYVSDPINVDMENIINLGEIPSLTLLTSSEEFYATSLSTSGVIMPCPTVVGLRTYVSFCYMLLFLLNFV